MATFINLKIGKITIVKNTLINIDRNYHNNNKYDENNKYYK